MSEDVKFPHTVVGNRNVRAMLMDKLVELGALTSEASEEIIAHACPQLRHLFETCSSEQRSKTARATNSSRRD